jgi:hypothetical protein
MTNTVQTNDARIPMIDKGEDNTPSSRRIKILSYILVAIMLVSGISMIMPTALNMIDDKDTDNSSTLGWNPNPDPQGKREAVYLFNHWGEDYFKNEKWNTTLRGGDYDPLTASMANLGHHGIFTASSTRTHSNPTGMGVEDWLNGTSYRTASYGEYPVRVDKYPYIFANDPNSPETPNVDTATATDWIIWVPFRTTGTIKNETMARTGSGGTGADLQPWRAFFVPHLGRGDWDAKTGDSGGYINCTYYGTYLTNAEVTIIKTPKPAQNSVHYAQWFYGASGSFLSGNDDGYFYELQGNIEYSRQAAIAYLGYSDASGDARTWFTTNQAAITAAWKKDWQWNGSEPATRKNATDRGVMGIYTFYEFDLNNSGMFNLILKLDYANSSYRTLVIRVYSVSFGVDSLILRMMERSNATGWLSNNTAGRNIRGSMLDYHDDLYWNITAGPSKADMFFRMVNTYRMTAWEDPSSSVFMGGWMLETFHPDYLGNGAGTKVGGTYWSYPSPFERYDPDTFATDRTTISLVPGTRRYQQNASYWTSPTCRNISKYECIIYDLNMSHWGMGSRNFIGINPTWVANPTGWGGPPPSPNGLKDNVNKGNFTKAMYAGKLKLGDYCTPFPIVKAGTAYDSLNQVLNISGGSATGGTVGIYMEKYTLSGRDYWVSNEARAYVNGKIYAHGTPFIQLDVVPIDDYAIDIRGTHKTTISEPVKISAINVTGGTGMWIRNPTNNPNQPAQATMYWNGTVTLTATDGSAAWGANGSTHTFTQGDQGVWWTSITWNTIGAQTITAQDTTNSTTSFTDIVSRASITIAIIPEFADILIPVMGMAAIFFAVKTKKRKSEEY